jgi:hypothetical protein
MNVNRLLRRKQASDYLREKHGLERAPSTLAKLAVIGGGPIFRYAGRIPLYPPENLDAYAESVLSPPMHSTSEVAFADSGTSERSDFSSASENRGRKRQTVPKEGESKRTSS